MTEDLESLSAFRPNWEGACDVCEATPVVSATGLCGPCTWGEADTMNGAWWGDDDEKRYQAALASTPRQDEEGQRPDTASPLASGQPDANNSAIEQMEPTP